MVGATVHHIDPGIDSGDIIRTLRPAMAVDDPYEYIEAKVFLDGFEALLAAIPVVARGQSVRVKQWQKGQLFLQRTGHRYEPFHRLRANRKIERGLLEDYLADRTERDREVRLVN